MEVTAWNNGQHLPSGAGYGVKLSPADRDTAFDRNWEVVTVKMEGGQTIQVNVAKESF